MTRRKGDRAWRSFTAVMLVILLWAVIRGNRIARHERDQVATKVTSLAARLEAESATRTAVLLQLKDEQMKLRIDVESLKRLAKERFGK